MRLRGRPQRRPDHWSSPHERARVRAAERLMAPLRVGEDAWLEAHLAECEPCRGIAAAYGADQLAIRLLQHDEPLPPRDLWARTAAGIERESAIRRRAGRPTRRRPATSLPALGALSGIAVVALVVVATAISGGWSGGVGPVAVAPTATPALASPDGGPNPTALAVVAERVHWLGAGANGVFAYNAADISVVCQRDRQPDCAPFADEHAKRVTLTAIPRFIFQSPIDDQAIVVGTDANGADAVLLVSLPAPDPATDPAAVETAGTSPDATAGPIDSPVPTSSPTSAPNETTAPNPTDAPATGTPIGTDAPIVSPSEIASASLASSGEPVPSESTGPEPSPTAVVIITDVVVVGRSASYSPDGTWFAFSARPSDGSAGPDIYVWHVGDLQARALTTDHASVFASWVSGNVLGSRLSAEPLESAAPVGRPGESPSVDPTPEISAPSDGTASPATSPSTEPVAIPERLPQSFLVDPWTGVESPLIESEWQPAVDPSGLVVVAWQGTVGMAADGLTAVPVAGNLVVHPFRGPPDDGASPASPSLSPETSPGSSPSISPQPSGSPPPSESVSPQPTTDVTASPSPQVASDFPTQVVVAGPIADFDARWDDTGSWLAIWIADPIDSGLGRLSLLHFDRVTGLVDRPVGAPQDVTALPGFSIGFGRLAWASPPGQSGEGSRIQIAAWTADEVGAIESIPVEGAIVVQ